MLDRVEAVYLETSELKASPVMGALPSLEIRQNLKSLLAERPMAQKTGVGMAISVPFQDGKWCIWIFSDVPKVAELQALLQRVQAISLGFNDAKAAASVAVSPIQDISKRVKPVKKKRRIGAMAAILCDQVVEHGEARAVYVFQWHKGDVRKIWGSDLTRQLSRSDLRPLLNSMISDEHQLLSVAANTSDDEMLDLALLARRLGAETIVLSLPVREQGGYGYILLEPSDETPFANELPAVMQITSPIAPLEKKRVRMTRLLGWAVFIMTAVFLLWPVQTRITVAGTALPSQSNITALPTDATLENMFVSVGDYVAEGDLVAQFFSTELAESAEQEKMNISVEELNAKRAMSENNYGAYQMSEARRNLAQTRLAQVEARIAALQVRAPIAGRVINAIPDAVKGKAFSRGEDVVEVQSGDGFRMLLQPSRVDALLLDTGVIGFAYFKGLKQDSYGLEITSPVMLQGQGGPNEQLVATAQVTSGDTQKLISGLSGYARLNGPNQPRVLGFTRYAVEYIRVKAWTYLGLQL